MPDLDVEQETGLFTPVEEPCPETAAPTPASASASTTGEVVRRLGETARVDHALSPPAETPASLLSRPAYAMAANAPQKARLVLDLQQRYGNAYTQQVMTLVQPVPAEPAAVAPEDEAPSDAPAALAEPAAPATPAVSAALAMSAAPAVPPTPTRSPASPPTPAVVKPEASPMPETAKPEAPPTPAVAEAAPQPLVAAPLEPEAPPPAEAVAVPPEAAMAPLAAEPENPTPEADVSAEAEAAEEEAMAETPAAPEGETEASAEEAAAVEEAEAEAESTEEAAPEAAPAEGAAEGAAPAEGGAGAAAGDRAPASPEEDPAFQAVIKRSKGVAKAQRAHAPASNKAAAAQGAASGPSNEVASMAAGAQVGEMDAQEPQAFDRESFKAALLEKIEKTAPRNLKEADNFKDSGKLDAVKRDMTSTVGEKKAQAQGNIAEATQAPPDTTGIEPKPVIPLEPADAGLPPADLGATAAAPKPKTDSEISLQEGSDSLDQQMQDNEITEAQLENANEPAFQGAVDSKRTAQTDAQERPLAYRQEEQGMVAEAKTTAVGSAEAQLTAMHGTRSSLLEQVATGQVETKSEDELKRVEVANHIEAIYQRTKTNVETRLASLDEEVNQAFDSGSARAQQAFEAHVKTRMDAYKDDRYSGVRGKYRWVRDKFKGLPKAVNVFYEEGRDLYLAIMDGVLDNIAIIVETGLNDAKAKIVLGKQEVQTYVDSLPVDLQDVGQQAADKIQSKFDELEQQVNDKQGELVDALAKKYHDNLQKLDARIEEMKAANRGLIDKALGAIVGIIKTILALKDMLLNVLARAAAVIGTIISDPIGFLGNLVSAVMMGLENFMANIGQHLKKGLMEWLFGALGEAGIEMPDSFDFKGILSLVLQILGLTYANIRARAVNIVGEDVVKRIEQTVEIFKVLMTEGPAGLWNMIQEQVGNLKDMVLDGIESFIKEKVLIAGITWIISLLNPAAAFIKACKAIYDIVMFFVQRGSQILALVNAVLDSVTAIAQGALGAAAAAVENALAKAIPVAIAFLASLLGLGGISDKIRAIIDQVRAPVNRAIDWIINKAVSLGQSVLRTLGLRDEETGEEEIDPTDHQALAERAVHDLETTEDSTESYETLRTQKDQQARQLEEHYSAMLESGIGLFVRFESITKEKENKDIYFEVTVAPNTEEAEGKIAFSGPKTNTRVKLENDVLIINDSERFEVGNQIQVKSGGGWKLGPHYITKFSTLNIGGTEVVRLTCNTDPPTLEITLLAQSYPKEWRKPIESLQGMSAHELQIENDKEVWKTFDIAKKVLNYRVHEVQYVVPTGKNWEHIVEQGSIPLHSSENLALADSTLNNRLAAYYNTVQTDPRLNLVLEGITEPISLRDFVQGKSAEIQHHWKLRVYKLKDFNVSLRWENNGRGRFQVLK